MSVVWDRRGGRKTRALVARRFTVNNVFVRGAKKLTSTKAQRGHGGQ